jgi:hypothetical protein
MRQPKCCGFGYYYMSQSLGPELTTEAFYRSGLLGMTPIRSKSM